MAINFPTSPTPGQKYPQPAVVGQPVYTWDGEKWATGATTPIGSAPLTALAGSNILVNSGFEVSQELGEVQRVASGYLCDVWGGYKNGTMVTAGGRWTSPVSGFNNRLFIQFTTAQTSLGAGDYTFISQNIEGYRVARLGWGAAGAQPMTIGFWSYNTPSGTYSVFVQNGLSNRSYVTTYTQAVAGVSQYNVVTIPGDTAGTWNKGNTVGMVLGFTAAAGTNFITAPNVWTAGNLLAATGQVNGAASTSNTISLMGPVALPGTIVLTAEQSPNLIRPYAEELALVQRYYYRRDYASTNWIATLQAWGGNAASGKIADFPVSMRSAPTIAGTAGFTVFNSVGTGYPITGGVYGATTEYYWLSGVGGSGIAMTPGDAVLFSVNANSYVLFDARI